MACCSTTITECVGQVNMSGACCSRNFEQHVVGDSEFWAGGPY